MDWNAEIAQARQDQHLSLEAAAAATRISAAYLTAIEAGDLKRLPGDLFARSFVRSYAQFLRLDGDAVVARVVAAGAAAPPARAPKAEPGTGPAWASAQAALVAVIAALALGAGLAGARLLRARRARPAEPARVSAPAPAPLRAAGLTPVALMSAPRHAADSRGSSWPNSKPRAGSSN